MRLADGSPSDNVIGCTEMNIARADMPNRVARLPVFVVNGPHCLLGRPTLQQLWQEQYNDLSDVARQSLNAVNLYNTDVVNANMVATAAMSSAKAVTTSSLVSSVPNVTLTDAEHETSVPE